MKRLLLLPVVFCFSLLNTIAQEIPEVDNQLIDKAVSKMVTIEKKRIAGDTISKVLTGSVYQIDIITTINNSSSTSTCYIVVKDGKLIELEDMSENRPMARLLSLMRKDFYLKSENDAKIFETVLDKIFPLGWSDKDAKEHMKAANKWYFIRGKFFDSKKGFIVTIDPASKITAIEYSLEAIKKQ
jgi:hypothetical protein